MSVYSSKHIGAFTGSLGLKLGEGEVCDRRLRLLALDDIGHGGQRAGDHPLFGGTGPLDQRDGGIGGAAVTL